MTPEKRYLGASVYADVEHGMVKLTTEDTKTVLAQLIRFISNPKSSANCGAIYWSLESYDPRRTTPSQRPQNSATTRTLRTA
jgi:hypothetical protein